MTPINLTDQQRTELEVAIRRSPSGRECRRAQALLWLAEGQPVERVAELLRVRRQTISNWVRRFRERAGLDLRDRLADAPRTGRPRAGGGGVDPLIAAVIDSDPRDLGYRATTWTAPLLSRYLREHHRVTACDRTPSRAIDRLGVRWKRPRHRLARRPETWRQAKGGSSVG